MVVAAVLRGQRLMPLRAETPDGLSSGFVGAPGNCWPGSPGGEGCRAFLQPRQGGSRTHRPGALLPKAAVGAVSGPEPWVTGGVLGQELTSEGGSGRFCASTRTQAQPARNWGSQPLFLDFRSTFLILSVSRCV